MPHLRFRSGVTQLALFPVAATTVVEPGDLVYLTDGTVKPAAELADGVGADALRGSFASRFVGVAHSGSAAGVGGMLSVDTGPLAVYELDLAAGPLGIGDALAPAFDGTRLRNGMLEIVSDSSQAIARAAAASLPGATTCRVRFATTVHPASANISAAVG